MTTLSFRSNFRWLGWALWLLVIAGSAALYSSSRWHSDILQDDVIRQHVAALATHLPSPAAGQLRVVHFLDPSCPCTPFTLEHLATLKPLLSKLNAQQWLIAPDAGNQAAKRLATTIGATLLSESLPLRVGPAIAIWDPQGELAYFGPYSLSMICGQDQLLEQILNTIVLKGWKEAPYSIETGCFCPWPHS